jgi:hypothetical protein
LCRKRVPWDQNEEEKAKHEEKTEVEQLVKGIGVVMEELKMWCTKMRDHVDGSGDEEGKDEEGKDEEENKSKEEI